MADGPFGRPKRRSPKFSTTSTHNGRKLRGDAVDAKSWGAQHRVVTCLAYKRGRTLKKGAVPMLRFAEHALSATAALLTSLLVVTAALPF